MFVCVLHMHVHTCAQHAFSLSMCRGMHTCMFGANVDSFCETNSGIGAGVQHLSCFLILVFTFLGKSNPGVEQSLNPHYILKAQRRGADHLL